MQAILNLVAAAVPGLKPQNIAIIDSRGDLLARAGEPAGAAAAGAGRRGGTRAELRIAHAVEDMLERGLGSGQVRAEASVRMNFDQVKETTESTIPTARWRAARRASIDAAPRPPTRLGAEQSAERGRRKQPTGSQEARQEETTNYEISKTVRTLVHDQPQIERISLAVMVDDADVVGPNGKHDSSRARRRS